MAIEVKGNSVPNNTDGKLPATPVVEAGKVEPTVEAPVVVKTFEGKTDPAERVVNTWNLHRDEEDMLVGLNSITGRSFRGTKEEFRAMLNG